MKGCRPIGLDLDGDNLLLVDDALQDAIVRIV